MAVSDPGSDSFVEDAFWIVLGRAPSAVEVRDEMRGAGRSGLSEGARRVLLMRLLASPEFEKRLGASHDPDAERARGLGLSALGPDDCFVARAYECLLGRPADPGGLGHYVAALGSGDSRADVLQALLGSDEFRERRTQLTPDGGVLPQDVQLCELANPAKWDNAEWVDILRDLGLSDDKWSMHRKPYEFTQLVYGCRRLGALTADATVLSVGAGHELVLYWLANHVRRVVATDMYEGVWQDVQGREGDPDVIRRPQDYAPFPYREAHLGFLKMDGRRLAFRDGTFDIAYSLSSIEHFGGMPGASATLREMGRVLKPGGILALATEYVLKGPPHDETFQPAEFASLIDLPGLALVEPLDHRVYDRYQYQAIDLYRNPYQTPHMVVRFDDTVFTTAMVFLRKL